MVTKIFQHKKQNFALLTRKQKWKIKLQRWVIALLCITTLIIFTVTNIHPFLAVNYPIKADVLVVAGWLTDYALEQVITEFKGSAYQLIITTGGPLDRGFYLAEYKSFAELSAATLEALGLKKEKIVAISTPSVIKDRTYASAAAVQQWISNSNLKLKALNIFSSDVHARRSWLIYKQVFAPKIKVGVIAAKQQNYEPSHWWNYSAGVRQILNELIAYIYARFVNIKA